MPEAPDGELSPVPKAPMCAACGKPMRLASAEPTTPYVNIDRLNYLCDCGQAIDKVIARKD
jgi:hypothetical protein